MAAIGHADSNPLPIHGPLWFDAREFGVSTKNADNTPALQAAHDAAAAAAAAWMASDGSRAPLATVYIPGAKGTYFFKNPVFVDGSCVRFLGEGRGSAQGTKLAKVSGFGSPVFMVGLSRTYGGVLPNATYRPDLWNGGSPKLDNTVVAGANQLWGRRTNGDLFAMSIGSALTHGGFSNANRSSADYWQECDYLTIEAAVEGFAAGRMPLAFVGCGNGPQAPVPFVLSSVGGGSYSVFVGYQTTRFGPITVGTYSFPAGAATGVVRLTVQVDLINRAVTAWVNGTQVAVTGGSPPANARFPEPGTSPGANLSGFFINASYNSSIPGGADFALYGMSVSKTLKYANKGAGTAQVPNPQICNGVLTIPGTPTGGTFTITYGAQTTAPIAYNASAATVQAALQALSSIGGGNATVTFNSGNGGQYSLTGLNGVNLAGVPSMCDGSNLTGVTVSDCYRYFPVGLNHGTAMQVDQWDIVHFLFNENPSTNTRHLSVGGNQSVGGRTSSVFLCNGHTLDPITSSVYFEGLEIDADQGYGTAIMRAHVLEQHYDNCRIGAGLWGIADAIYGANYVNYIHNCLITAFDSSLALFWSIVNLDTVTFQNNGRWTLRLTGCQVNFRNIQVAATGSPQYGFCRICDGIYGGEYVFDNVVIDNEGVDYGLAAFYAERHAYTGVQLTVTNSYLGLPGSCDMFMLKDQGAPPVYTSAVLTADFINADIFGSVVSVDGPGWTFNVAHTGSDGGSDVYNIGTYPGTPRGKVESSAKLPVRYGQAWAGCSRLTNPGPSDGQFSTLLPAVSGAWGSSTPARWVGAAPLLGDPAASLAAYMQDHTSYGATLSGQASAFGYTTNPVATPLISNTLFGGGIIGASTVLTLGGSGLGGTFTLGYGGQTTSALAYNASAATIQTALQALPSVGAGNMTVSGATGGPWTISLAGTLSRLSGGILGLTVNGSGLTATAGSATLTNGSIITLGGSGLGGTFTVTYNGQTTAPIAYNASALTVANAVIALNTSYSAYMYVTGAPGGPYQTSQGLNSVNGSGLTATGGTALLTPTDVPSTWYVGLLLSPARKRNFPLTETITSLYGFVRKPLANSSSGFTASSAGTKASAAAVTFPAATLAGTVTGIALYDAPVGGNIWATIQLAQPLAVAVGDTPTINSGGITLANVPSLGSFGSFTNYGWGKLYDLLFGGVPFTVPTTWYAGLSTAALTRASTSPTEPSGNAYARVGVANDSAHWTINPPYGQAGDIQNPLAIAFPTPSGPWGTIQAAALCDASSAGNAWVVAPLTAPVTPGTAAAPTFAAGSLMLGLG